jgi:small subunit ribosomal protein S1
VRGRVTQVRDFGLFVDIGGVEGLLHQSELSWERGVKPEDVAKVGDELDVQVLNVHERESKRERHDRISLSIKALQPDPWKVAVDSIVEGQPRKGKVVRTAEFGAFVQLAPGVDGLLHISELGRELKHADQVLSVGDDIYVVVERIDRKARRLSLSRLSNEEGEAFERGELTGSAEAPRVRQGGSVRVKVTHVGPAGLEVQVDNAIGKRGRGFIPNSEMGTPKGTDHRRQWPPGTELDVLVIGTDRDGALRCSRKRQLMEEERRAVREYRKEVSRQGLGTFADLLRQKLGGGE